MNSFYLHQKAAWLRSVLPALLLISITIGSGLKSWSQCPPNIDFEQGNFTGWKCYTGTVNSGSCLTPPDPNVGVVPVWTLSGPVFSQHTMLSSTPGNGVDQYGGFPQNCPNGSGHSIKLGDNVPNRSAARVKYTFTIPIGQDEFSLTYFYAIILQDLLGHCDEQKPKFKIQVIDVTDGNIPQSCSSFDFNSNGSLPGFFTSPSSPANAPVRCKDWSAASINLKGYAGKTFDLIFSTQDCSQGGHFGYAYIDINTQCSSSFVGAAYCPQDTSIDVTAPFGFQGYKWFNSSFTQVLGTSQVLHLSPPPPTGTTIAVQVIPYNGYGCQDTLYAQLLDTINVTADAGPDTVVCNGSSVPIGRPGRTDLKYSWSPTTGLSNPNIANPMASPTATTTYILTVTSLNGGCGKSDTVVVRSPVLDNTITITGGNSTCQSSGSNTILHVQPADSIQWYKDNIFIPGATQPNYTVVQSGTYHAVIFSHFGCSLATADQVLSVYPKPVAGFTTNSATQCFSGNNFVFTNTSSVSSGNPLQYSWQLGDASPLETGTDVFHSYTAPGIYTVKLKVTADGGCLDSISANVTILASPDTTVTQTGGSAYCAGDGTTILKVNPAATIQWYKDNVAIAGANSTQYTVTQTGVYYALVSGANNCSLASANRQITIYAKPVAGFTVNTANQCFTNNQFLFTNTSTLSSGGALTYSWNLGDATTDVNTDVTHSYSLPGAYKVRLLATGDGGCVDSSNVTINVYANPDTTVTLTGSDTYCVGHGQSVLKVSPTGSTQWFKDNVAIAGATASEYIVTQTGLYHVMLTTVNGCSLTTTDRQITVYAQPVAAFTVNNAGQCFSGNSFNFTNTSTIGSGTIQYTWDLGDGTIANTTDILHSYGTPGTYQVKMIASSAGGCADTSKMTVVVSSVPTADFKILPVCVNLQVPLVNQTINNTGAVINYLWDFGNTQTSTSYNPVYAFPSPGNYTVKLSVSTIQCPLAISTKQLNVVIDAPMPGIAYPVQNAILNFPLPLQSRTLNGSVTWNPAVSLDKADSYTPTFRGFSDQLYTITLKNPTGCVTVDTQLVKTYKKINIYVPTMFTPNGDGVNDLLRPLLMSFKEVHYFRIMNRWGNLLFEMKSDRPGWDGRVNGILQETQTVVWMIEAVDVDGVVHREQGTTILMR